MLKKNGRLNVLADNLRNDVTFEGVTIDENNHIVSNAPQTNITIQQSTSVTLGNTESSTRVMDKVIPSPSESTVEEDNEYLADEEFCTKNTFERRIESDITNSVNDNTDKCVSDIVLDQNPDVRIDINSLQTVENRNDKPNITKASLFEFENMHNKDEKENIKSEVTSEKDKPFERISTECPSHKDKGKMLRKQVIHTRTRKRENGYKSKSMEIHHDNRVSYHNKHECFGGATINNILNMDLEKEEFIQPNINTVETVVFTQERLESYGTYQTG